MPDELKARLLAAQDSRITDDGVIIIKAQSFNSQTKNHADALERLAKLPIRADVCQSYYLDKGGRNQFVWPEYGVIIKKRLTQFERNDYAWG